MRDSTTIGSSLGVNKSHIFLCKAISNSFSISFPIENQQLDRNVNYRWNPTPYPAALSEYKAALSSNYHQNPSNLRLISAILIYLAAVIGGYFA